MEDDIFIVYTNKEEADAVTYEMFKNKNIPLDNFIIIENLKDGVYIPSEEYDDITVYCLEEDLEDKIKSYSKVYDSIHVRFFNVDLDDVKNKYSKIIKGTNTNLILFEEVEEEYSTTIKLNSEDISDMEYEVWDEKKDALIDAINELAEDFLNNKVFFKADYSFTVNKNQKKINIEFDENRALYRIRVNSEPYLILNTPEVKNMVEILHFLIEKSED